MNNIDLSYFQLAYSTADDVQDNFTPDFRFHVQFEATSFFPRGVYRVIDGQIAKIIGLEPPD